MIPRYGRGSSSTTGLFCDQITDLYKNRNSDRQEDYRDERYDLIIDKHCLVVIL